MTKLVIYYKPTFIRQFSRLASDIQEEALEKIGLFSDTKRHAKLAVHKLHGKLEGYSSFSVNFKYRIVLKYFSKKEVVFLSIGDHEIYR